MQNKCIFNNILETCNTLLDFLKGKALIIYFGFYILVQNKMDIIKKTNVILPK